MKAHHILIVILLPVVILAFRCKDDDDSCIGLQTPGAHFAFKEVLRDTAFFADTVFADNPVLFTTLSAYKSQAWKVGDDPREFTSDNFSLIFYPFVGSIEVAFVGRNEPNPNCFPGDSGVYHGLKKLTIVEQVDRSSLTISPLVGYYRGAYNNNPLDSFTVRIEYFDSAKYSPVLGMRNFYWISNMPQGFENSTDARIFPELRNGMDLEMGYKCFSFGNSGSIASGQGLGELINGSLKIYCNHPLTGRKIFIAKRI